MELTSKVAKIAKAANGARGARGHEDTERGDTAKAEGLKEATCHGEMKAEETDTGMRRGRKSLVGEGDFRRTWAKPQAALCPGSTVADPPWGGLGGGADTRGGGRGSGYEEAIGGLWVR